MCVCLWLLQVSDAIIAHGSYIYKSTIANAVIGLRAIIEPGCTIQVCVCGGGGGRGAQC